MMAGGAPNMGFPGGGNGFPGGGNGFSGGAPNGPQNGFPVGNSLMASMPGGGMPGGMGATPGGIENTGRPLSAYEQQEAALRESEVVQQLEDLKNQKEADENFRSSGGGGGGFPGMGGETGGGGLRGAAVLSAKWAKPSRA
jgi:hypothetical protein